MGWPMRKALSSATAQSEGGALLELTAYGEDTEAGEASAANRRMLHLTLDLEGKPPVDLFFNGTQAQVIAGIAAEAGVLIESEADVARRYLANFRDSLHPEAIAELERMARGDR